MVSIEERNTFIEGHYRLNYHRLVGYTARKVGHNNAEDVVQEAYARAIQYFDTFTPGQDFDMWFKAIWENAGRKLLNEQEETAPIDEVVIAMPAEAEHVFELSVIQDKLRDEKPAHRQVIIHHLILGYTREETAFLLNLPEGQVASLVHRFRESLK